MIHQYKGTIGVGVGDKMYRDTDANYEKDAGRPTPVLPEGIDERLYEPGRRHALICNHDVIDGGPMPWDEGDAILPTLDNLLAAQETRQRKEVLEEAARNKLKLEEQAAARS